MKTFVLSPTNFFTQLVLKIRTGEEMKKLKSNLELLGEPFLCKAEVRRLLGLSPKGTNTIYDRAMWLDKEAGRDWESPKKVSTQSVLAVSNISYELLVKQTKMRMLQHPHS